MRLGNGNALTRCVLGQLMTLFGTKQDIHPPCLGERQIIKSRTNTFVTLGPWHHRAIAMRTTLNFICILACFVPGID